MGQGETKAIKAAGLRVPDTANEAERALADRAQQRIIDVMEEQAGGFSATPVLKAAIHLREEICGAVKQKVEHSGLESLTDEQLKARLDALLTKANGSQERLSGPSSGADQGEGP